MDFLGTYHDMVAEKLKRGGSSDRWVHFSGENGRAGTLFLRVGEDYRAIVTISAASPVQCVDLGERIARCLNKGDQQ